MGTIYIQCILFDGDILKLIYRLDLKLPEGFTKTGL
jgi:hypothetical protein